MGESADQFFVNLLHRLVSMSRQAWGELFPHWFLLSRFSRSLRRCLRLRLFLNGRGLVEFKTATARIAWVRLVCCSRWQMG